MSASVKQTKKTPIRKSRKMSRSRTVRSGLHKMTRSRPNLSWTPVSSTPISQKIAEKRYNSNKPTKASKGPYKMTFETRKPRLSASRKHKTYAPQHKSKNGKVFITQSVAPGTVIRQGSINGGKKKRKVRKKRKTRKKTKKHSRKTRRKRSKHGKK